MRGHGQGMAVIVRRALARVIARRSILGLAVSGDGKSDLAAVRILVRLRGKAAMDAGAVLAFGRSLRRMLEMPPGSGFPVLVVNLMADDAQEQGGTGVATGRDVSSRGRPVAQTQKRLQNRHGDPAGFGIDHLYGQFDALKRKGRRSRSPPSPPSALVSAVG